VTTRTLLVVVFTALLASACGALQRNEREPSLAKYEPYIGEPIRGFTSYRLDSWQSIGREQLILWTGVNEAYLVTVWNTCPELQFAETIRVTSTTSEVSTFDQVLVGKDRCQIKHIQPIDVRRMRADREAARSEAQ